MQNKIIVILISLGLTSSLTARTGLNCTKVLEMRPDLVMACYNQTNDWLNDSYQVLLNTRKDSLEQISSLKDTQSSWRQERDTQCKLAIRDSAGDASIEGMKCAVLMTQQRAQALEKMASNAGY